jgi:hypothetical protein
MCVAAAAAAAVAAAAAAASAAADAKREMEDDRPKKRPSIMSPDDDKLRAKKKMSVRFQEDNKTDERPNKITSPGELISFYTDCIELSNYSSVAVSLLKILHINCMLRGSWHIDLVLIDPQSVGKRTHDLMDTVNAKKRWKTI